MPQPNFNTPQVSPTPQEQPALAGQGFYLGEHSQGRERGSSNSSPILIGCLVMMGAGVCGFSGAALGLYDKVTGIVESMKPRSEVVPTNSTVVAKLLQLEPEDYACTTRALSELSGSNVRVVTKVADKEIPGLGSNIIADKELVNLNYCLDQGTTQDDYKRAVKITQEKPIPGSTYNPVTVTIPLEKIKVIVAPDVASRVVKVNHDVTLGIALGAGSAGSAAIKAACNGALLARSDGEQVCEDFTNKFDIPAMEAQLAANGEAMMLEAARKKCSPNYWAEIQANTVKTYKNQAIRWAGGDKKAGDAVTVVFTLDGKPTNEPPAFDDAFASNLEKKGKNDTIQAELTDKTVCIVPQTTGANQ
ncbi:MAG: hypothetical protein WAQ24_04150 [Candidatus Saccharimonadales bacterium]